MNVVFWVKWGWKLYKSGWTEVKSQPKMMMTVVVHHQVFRVKTKNRNFDQMPKTEINFFVITKYFLPTITNVFFEVIVNLETLLGNNFFTWKTRVQTSLTILIYWNWTKKENTKFLKIHFGEISYFKYVKYSEKAVLIHFDSLKISEFTEIIKKLKNKSFSCCNTIEVCFEFCSVSSFVLKTIGAVRSFGSFFF